jgi:hypothetical protein
MPGPAAKPDLVFNGWLPSVPWAEYLSQHGGVQDGAFGYGPAGNSAVLVVLVPFEETVSAIEEILGAVSVEVVSAAAPRVVRLNRTLPRQHPHYYWLYAEKITSVKPVHFEEKGTINGETAAIYTFAAITVAFTQPHYVQLSDADLDRLYPPVNVGGDSVRQEWQRFVEITPEPALEVLQTEKEMWKWAESDGGAGGPTAGTTISAPRGILLGKTNYVLRWRHVPAKFLFGDSGRSLPASNIDAVVGHVNDDVFMKATKGTLLCLPPRYIVEEAPVPPEVVGANPALGEPGLLYTVEVPLQKFDPASGKGVYFGHNLMPFKGNARWYLITSNGDPATGVYPAPLESFAKIFKGV